MARYQLRHPVRAAQFDGANAEEVFDLINFGGGGSMMSDRKQLKAYNLAVNGGEVLVEAGQWVVVVAKGVEVLDNSDFQQRFVEAE